MPRVALVAGGRPTAPEPGFDYLVGVDAACLFLLDNGWPLHLAVGDFDSVSAPARERIQNQAGAFHQAQPEKNDTDTELALKLIFDRWPTAQVTIYGAFGGRIDHELSNLFLPSDPDLAPFMRQFVLRDELNHVQYFPAGRHKVAALPGMTYLSLMTADSGRLTIEQAKYPLTASNFFQKKIYTSNEFVDGEAVFSLNEGYALVIQSRDRSV